MAEIILSDGKIAIVDDCDFERLSKFKWQSFTRGKCTYARRSVKVKRETKNFSMHNEILGLKNIDHIDGNGLNNKRDNMRPCSHVENMRNRRKHIFKTSKFKGVAWKKTHQKFESYIRMAGTLIPLGYFDSQKEAAEIYNLAAALFFGKFAKLNIT